jgi:hypothetical protein
MTHRKRAQKLSLGSFLRPKSKEFVVCHDPQDCVPSPLIADLIDESAHLFRAVAPVLGIVKKGLVGVAHRLRQRWRAPLLASQEENEWPREDHTNPFAQPERTGIVRVHQKSQDQPGAKVRRNTAPDRRAQAVLRPPSPPGELRSARYECAA